METVRNLLIILISSSLVSNVVLSQFLGLCPFLGVSKKTNTAAGMGAALIFVITLSSAIAGVIYKFLLVPFHLEYLQTIVFILVIAALVQFVEMFLKKYMKSFTGLILMVFSVVSSFSAFSVAGSFSASVVTSFPAFPGHMSSGRLPAAVL